MWERDILTSRYEICGSSEMAVGEKPDWLSFIIPEHRAEADALWNDVYTGGLATKTAEWQFVNGRWGESSFRVYLYDNG